jgi:hypothetical protein
MAKQKMRAAVVKSKQVDLFLRETPPDVIKTSLKIRNKACGFTMHDFAHAFTI